MDKEALKLVIVGSFDHGKSTLIGRLFYDTDSLPEGRLDEIRAASEAAGRDLEFGFMMDHLSEERSRGVTIDTAQAFFSTDARDYVIIDAPGHKEFLKNMITGASQADAAVLICSAYEGVEDQTRRHAHVLKLLGIRQTIVAYNKMDLVGHRQADFERAQADMREFLGRIGVEPTREIPISARDGDNVAKPSENMPWYDGPTVLEALDDFRKAEADADRPVRFPVQDVYDVGGESVTVGRVEAGVLRAGDVLRFVPGGVRRRVAAIRKWGEDDPAEAGAGECIGVVFDGGPAPVRGEVGCPVDDPTEPVDVVEASVFWLAPEPLAVGEPLTLRCATQEAGCAVEAIRERIDSSTLECTERDARALDAFEVGEVTIRTRAPMLFERFAHVPELGRFILLRGKDVVAGGIVTGT